MTQALLFLTGLVALVAGASALVRGASKLALRLGLSPLVVGLTVVAYGTSAPELAVSAGAALDGRTALAVGNVVGSNIFNVLLILGLSALITPLRVHLQVVRQEAPIMIAASALLAVLCLDGEVGRLDSTLLLALLVAYTVFVVRQARATGDAGAEEFAREIRPPAASAWDARLPAQLLLIVAGLGLLVAGSEALVSAAITFARMLGLSETVIGLTIVAAGTSLPEVATSVAASIKGERDIAVGNVVGSSIFNILGVLGAAGLAGILGGASSLPVPPEVMRFDLWAMLAAAVACLPVFLTGREIARWEGGLFLAYYAAYTTYLVLATQRHEGAPAFGDAMLGVVLPLTVVTLGVSFLRRRS